MPNPLHLKGLDAYKQGDYKKAISFFVRATTEQLKDPIDPESYLFLGTSYFLDDQKTAAIVPLKKYMWLIQDSTLDLYSKNGKISSAWNLIALCCSDRKEALSYYNKALEVNPRNSSAQANLGKYYIDLAEEQQSFELFNKAYGFLEGALQIDPTYPQFLHHMATWFDKRTEYTDQSLSDNFKTAIDYYQKALNACKPGDTAFITIVKDNLAECLAQYGHYFYQEQKYQGARNLYNQTLKYDAEHIPALNQIGMCYFRENSFSEARKQFEKILDISKNNKESSDAHLSIANMYRLEQLWDEAKKALDKARELNPTNADEINAEETKLKVDRENASLIAAPQALFNLSLSEAQQSKPTLEPRSDLNLTHQ